MKFREIERLLRKGETFPSWGGGGGDPTPAEGINFHVDDTEKGFSSSGEGKLPKNGKWEGMISTKREKRGGLHKKKKKALSIVLKENPGS